MFTVDQAIKWKYGRLCGLGVIVEVRQKLNGPRYFIEIINSSHNVEMPNSKNFPFYEDEISAIDEPNDILKEII